MVLSCTLTKHRLHSWLQYNVHLSDNRKVPRQKALTDTFKGRNAQLHNLIVIVGRAWGVLMWTCYSCLSVCLSVCALTGKRLELSTPNLLHVYSIAVARHALTQRSKGRGHTVTKTVTVALLLVTMAGIAHPLCYLRPLPAWVCMSIRLPMFSGCNIMFACLYIFCTGCVYRNVM